MRWRGRQKSRNVIDRRGAGRRGGKPALGLGGLILIGVISVWFGADPMQVIMLLADAPRTSTVSTPHETSEQLESSKEFVSVVLADTETTWKHLFEKVGQQYREPRLVLFAGEVQSACGYASAAVGPFYCPPDSQVYLDTQFFDELSRMGAAGDFAAAYVIAHEVGHHVQNLMGTLNEVHRAKRRLSEAEANSLQVKVELQADCFAGVWAHYADRDRQLLEPGDVEQGMAAAAAVGDDTLQKRAGRVVRPESFTHGTAKARVKWFRAGLESGSIASCQTL